MEKEVILVDCFNTIIMRKISPTEVLYRWAENVGGKLRNRTLNYIQCLYKSAQ